MPEQEVVILDPDWQFPGMPRVQVHLSCTTLAMLDEVQEAMTIPRSPEGPTMSEIMTFAIYHLHNTWCHPGKK